MAKETNNVETVVDNQQVVDTKPQGDIVETPQEDDAPSVESLMAEIAKMKAEAEKQKIILDKALKEKGDAVKALREKQSAEEIADEAKREQEEAHSKYVQDLELFKSKTLAKERYLLQGMTVEMAENAAQAEIDGDMDTLATIQKQHTDAKLKEAKAEWQKSIPETNRGTGDPTMTKEQIFAIKDPIERQRAIAANISLFGEI